MKTIYIEYFEDDGQIDVEVYEWKRQKKGELIEDLSDYGLESRHEADTYVQTLAKDFKIVKEEGTEEVQKEQNEKMKEYEEKMNKKTFKKWKPLFTTYKIDPNDFRERLEYHVSKKVNYPVQLSLESAYDFENVLMVEVKLDENPEWIVQSIAKLYDLDDEIYDSLEIGEAVIPEFFEEKNTHYYWSPEPCDDFVIVSIPL